MAVGRPDIQALPRTLEQVKAEILRRGGRLNPLEHILAEDAREAAAALNSLDGDHWAAVWSAIGLRHEARGDALQREGADARLVQEAFFAAYANCRTGRYPVASTAGKSAAQQHALRCYRKACAYFSPPQQEIAIAFDGAVFHGYLRVPAAPARPPVVMHWGGVDGWKEDRRRNAELLLQRGIASFAIDMPGTGDNPLRYADPRAVQTFSAALDVLRSLPGIDGSRVGVWGGSFGGYWAARLAHAQAGRLRAAVIQGGNVHFGFQRQWLEPALTQTASNYLLGPASLLEARSWVLGVSTLEEVLAIAPQLSLLDLGLLDGPCAPLLAVNGKLDDQAPIADVYLLLEHGAAKTARVYPQGGHMGRARGESDAPIAALIADWLRRRLEESPAS